MEERASTLYDARLACELRDKGMSQALSHAEFTDPMWGEKAYSVLLEYGPKLGRFTPTDIRACGLASGVPTPPDNRAWGPVLKRAQKAGKIRHDGYVPHPDPKSHRCPTRLWQWIG